MTKEEFQALLDYIYTPTLITHECLRNQNDRTLIYGCTFKDSSFSEKISFHLYLKNQKIKAVTYGYNGVDLKEIAITRNEDMIPQKRLYAERCDFEFCKVLLERGYHLSFTNYDDIPLEKQIYYGLLLEEDRETM